VMQALGEYGLEGFERYRLIATVTDDTPTHWSGV